MLSSLSLKGPPNDVFQVDAKFGGGNYCRFDVLTVGIRSECHYEQVPLLIIANLQCSILLTFSDIRAGVIFLCIINAVFSTGNQVLYLCMIFPLPSNH